MTTVALNPKNLSVWDVNMKELRRLQPRLALALENWVTLHGHTLEHDEMETPAGTWVSGFPTSGSEALEPFFQPNGIPERPWRKDEEKKVPLFFIYGVGVSSWLFRMLRSLPKGTLGVVVLEPNMALLACLLHTTNVYAAAPAGCRVSFAADPQEFAIEEALAVNVIPLGTYIASQARIWAHPGETEAFQAQMTPLQKALRERVITKLQELGNSAEDTLLGLRQIALSSPWIVLAPSLSTISTAYKGRPFIWVASGPSLDKNVHLLKENADRAVIICADTVVYKLLGLGIVPHITVALERGLPIYGYLEKTWTRYPEETKKILLVCQAVCVPEIAGKWPGPKIVVGKGDVPLDVWLVSKVLEGDTFYAGLSVAHMGIWLAAVMGASSLALMGQDLAFGEARQTHANSTVSLGAAQGESTENELKRHFTVPGALGGMVLTHSMWFLFLRLLERFVPMMGIPVFDCTEGGALIQGTTVVPLAKWIAANVDGLEPFAQTPASLVAAAAKTSDQRAESVRRVLKNIEEGMEYIRDTRKKLDGVDELIERVGAPALTPRQRANIGGKAADILDGVHRANPVLEFINQSQVTLGAAALAQVRTLDDVSSVQEWRRIHAEFVLGHRNVLDFMETWLRYIAVAVEKVNALWDEGYSIENLPFFPQGRVRDLNPLEKELKTIEAMEQLKRLAEIKEEDKDELLNTYVLLDNLLARADHKWWYFWDDRIDWKLALALQREGRNAEAAIFASRMERTSVNVFGLPREATFAFLKDGARIFSSKDLCHIPDYDRARGYAEGALGLKPDDPEAIALAQEVRDRMFSEYVDYANAMASQGSLSVTVQG
ncbi:MAG: DUF115 domain-containing protein [Synergistaceae bacterium]|jgi:hypothetical protein|nr:DUF115 domain-containing protein [Synergistaceae bacterium]